jgi:hypothetical protein
MLSARRSPRRGRVEDIFNLLASIPSLLCCPRFELELILSHQDELRVYRQGQAYRRHGWVVVGRRLVSVERSVRIASPSAAASLLPPGLPDLFDTAQLDRGSLSRAPARPTDDLLPASNGRPRHRRQTRQRHPPPPRRESMEHLDPCTGHLGSGLWRNPGGVAARVLVARCVDRVRAWSRANCVGLHRFAVAGPAPDAHVARSGRERVAAAVERQPGIRVGHLIKGAASTSAWRGSCVASAPKRAARTLKETSSQRSVV